MNACTAKHVHHMHKVEIIHPLWRLAFPHARNLDVRTISRHTFKRNAQQTHEKHIYNESSRAFYS